MATTGRGSSNLWAGWVHNVVTGPLSLAWECTVEPEAGDSPFPCCPAPCVQAVAAAALAGANLRGLGLPPHIEDPTTAVAPPPPAAVLIDGQSATPTHCLCLTGMVTAQRLASDAEYTDVSQGAGGAWGGEG